MHSSDDSKSSDEFYERLNNAHRKRPHIPSYKQGIIGKNYFNRDCSAPRVAIQFIILTKFNAYYRPHIKENKNPYVIYW